MQTVFYALDHNSSSGVDKEPLGQEVSKNKFPEDPGMDDGRVPDGGGPADGFIDKDGHSTGEGFLGHVDGGEGARSYSSDDDGGSEAHG